MYNQIKLLLISVFTLLVSQKIKPYVDGKVTDALTQAANTAQQKADAAKNAAETFATNADAANLLLAKAYADSKVLELKDNDIVKSFSFGFDAVSNAGNNIDYYFATFVDNNNLTSQIENGEKMLVFCYSSDLATALGDANPIQLSTVRMLDNLGAVMFNIPIGGSFVLSKASGQLVFESATASTYINDVLAIRTLSQTQIAQVITDLGQLQTAHDSLNTNFSNFLLQYQEFQTDYAAKQQEQDDAIAALDLKFADYLTAQQVHDVVNEAKTEILAEVGTILGV